VTSDDPRQEAALFLPPEDWIPVAVPINQLLTRRDDLVVAVNDALVYPHRRHDRQLTARRGREERRPSLATFDNPLIGSRPVDLATALQRLP